MKVLMLIEGTTVPASRFRALQFIPHLARHGVQCTVRHGYGPLYNKLSRTKLGGPYKLATRLRRVLGQLDAAQYDVVFVQRPAIPFSPLPEQLLSALNPRVLFDFDDNLTVGADAQPSATRTETFRTIVGLSRHVIAGNSFLAAQADAPEKLTIIPTVLDTDRYTPGDSPLAMKNHVLIGWMGTSGNFPSVRAHLKPVLDTLAAHPHARFRMVSNARLPELEGHPQVEQIAWTADTEIDHLRAFDIGLMPLQDNITTRGKCGFKMIQYMAVGTPVVSSAVGANVEIFAGSDAGHLVFTLDEWREALDDLVTASPARRRTLGAAARAHCDARYSIRGVLDTHLELLAQVAAS